MLGASARTLQRAEAGEGANSSLFRAAELLNVIESRVAVVMLDRRGRVVWRSRLADGVAIGERLQAPAGSMTIVSSGGRLVVLP